MKNSLFLLCSLVISTWQPFTATAQMPTTIPGIEKGAKKPQVMVLGTFHFENPGRDYVKTSVTDILSVERQKELRGLLDKIKEFKPTKIALEVEPKSAEKIITRYSSYLAGQDTLRRNETDQIGFRLAKELGHKTVYCVDFKKGMDFNTIMKTAQTSGQTDFLQRFQQGMGFIKAGAARHIDVQEYHIGAWIFGCSHKVHRFLLIGSFTDDDNTFGKFRQYAPEFRASEAFIIHKECFEHGGKEGKKCLKCKISVTDAH
jgi:hypothetical protein